MFFFSQTFEKLGLIPRSIIRTLQRFRKQIVDNSTLTTLYEFRLSRYQTIASFKCFINLFLIPLIFHNFVQKLLVSPLIQEKFINNLLHTPSTQYIWQKNDYGKIASQIQKLDDQFLFETLVQTHKGSRSLDSSYDHGSKKKFLLNYNIVFTQVANERMIKIQSIIQNNINDFFTSIIFFYLFYRSTPQIIILKSFLIESIYILSDTTKSFFLILGTDLLVGFHSSKGWELFLLNLSNHFGFTTNTDIVFLIVSTFPVILDTVFKYWIFRYLNKISPSTVATYQNMLE